MNVNSGYIGYSMSVRACEAYESGEKPFSKWQKQDILSELKNQGFNTEVLEKISLKILKEVFLYESSWHHTSKYFNKTYFYSVIDFENDIEAYEISCNEAIEKKKLNSFYTYKDFSKFMDKMKKKYRLEKLDCTMEDKVAFYKEIIKHLESIKKPIGHDIDLQNMLDGYESYLKFYEKKYEEEQEQNNE